MLRFPNLPVFLLCLAAPVAAVNADTKLVLGQEGGNHTFKVKNGRILIQQLGEGVAPQTIVYDQEKREMVLIDHSDKSFIRLEAAKLEKMANKLGDTLNQIDDRLEGLGGQQKAFRGLLQGALAQVDMSAQEEAMKEYKMRPTKSRIHIWECDVLDRKSEGKRDATFYLVDPAVLQIPEEDVATLMSLETFTNDLLSALPAGESIRAAVGPPDMYFPEGKIPVRTITYKGDEKVINQLREISVEAFEDTDFVVPEGYSTKALPF